MQKAHPGHTLSSKQRTTDVLTEEEVDFESLLLSPSLVKGLTESGFEKPSPIQLKAIPLGRCGLDLIAQAKSGTGKTCVFSVIALESINTESQTTQVLILAPTREIAVQIKDVVSAIGCHIRDLSCQVFIGGLPLEEDKKLLKGCHIAVGSPGRIKSLIEESDLRTDSIRMFILDEADKLLDGNFQEQINWIYSTLPMNKQMLAFSATYPESLANHLTRYMREPTFVRLNAADPTLQGVKQFYCVVPFHGLPHKVFQEKVDNLLKLLSKVDFHQCLLFSNYQIRAQNLASKLSAKGWPATFIAGSQTQQKRLAAIKKLKDFKCRILISTDLTARGIDAENVNLVVNMDIPRDEETYLHRIGRAGRFGTKGIAVTFVAKGKEEKELRAIETSIGIKMDALPDHIPKTLMMSDSPLDKDQGLPKDDTVEVNVLRSNSGRCNQEKSNGFQDMEDDNGILKHQQSKEPVMMERPPSDNTMESFSGSEIEVEFLVCSYQQSKGPTMMERVPSDNTIESSSESTVEDESLPSSDEQSKEAAMVEQPPSDHTIESCSESEIKVESLSSSDSASDKFIGNTSEQFTLGQHQQNVPSVEEFDCDFEEFLVSSSKLEITSCQENSLDSNVDINRNMDCLRCDNQDDQGTCNVNSQENLKTVNARNIDNGKTYLDQDEDDTCSDSDSHDSSDDDVDRTSESDGIQHRPGQNVDNGKTYIGQEESNTCSDSDSYDSSDDNVDRTSEIQHRPGRNIDNGKTYIGQDESNTCSDSDSHDSSDGDVDRTSESNGIRHRPGHGTSGEHTLPISAASEGRNCGNEAICSYGDGDEYGGRGDSERHAANNLDYVLGREMHSLVSDKKCSDISNDRKINRQGEKVWGHQNTEQSSHAMCEFGNTSRSFECSDQNGMKSANVTPDRKKKINDSNRTHLDIPSYCGFKSCDLTHKAEMEPNSGNIGNSGMNFISVPSNMYGNNVETVPPLSDCYSHPHQGSAYRVGAAYSPCHDAQWNDAWLNAFHSINNAIIKFARSNRL